MKELSAEEQRKALAEEMYLRFFNDYLYRQGVISKTAHDKMTVEIMHRGKKPLPKVKSQSFEMEM